MQERRGWQRMVLSGEVRYVSAGRHQRTAALIDLCFGGMAVRCVDPPRVSELLEFTVLPSCADASFTGRGKVAYVQADPAGTHSRVGIAFVEAESSTVTHCLNRLQLHSSDASRGRSRAREIDFIPY